MKNLVIQALSALALTFSCAAQPAATSMVGTVAGFGTGTPSIVVKADNGQSVAARLTPDTMAQRIVPGEKDLKNAVSVQVSDVAIGDRVLLTMDGEAGGALRIIVMSATDISKRNEADRLEWTRRGVNGIVASHNGDEIVLKIRGLTGETQAIVTVGPKTTFKKYSADSVKFSDAVEAKLADVAPGDQLRARGTKSEDGAKVQADEVVFGTFMVKSGTITAINPETKEVTVKELTGKKSLVIRLTADSQLKRMPDMAAMMSGGRGGPPGGMPGGMPGGAPQGGRGLPGAPGGFDIGQMVDRMPQARIEDLKAGETIVVSSASNAKNDHITAILLLGNAEALLQMAATPGGGRRGASGSMGGMGGMGMGGGMGDLSSLGLGGIIF
jgi:hypothetical protein